MADAITKNSEAEFILGHYWGYSTSKTKQTIEYGVAQEPWSAWINPQILVGISFAACYPELAVAFSNAPQSTFFAAGSKISVFSGVKI